MLSDGSFTIAVFTMAVVAFATRLAGAMFMSWIALTERTERFLDGLAVSVVAALVASMAMTADAKTVAAMGIAIVAMGLTRNVVWAMFLGMVTAAGYPFLIASGFA